jgi:hypothetical protein
MKWSIQELFVAMSYQWVGVWYINILSSPKYIYRNIKTFIHWLIKGYTQEMHWNLDDFLSIVIYEKLKQFRDYKVKYGNSHPCDLTDKQWEIILDKLVDGFKDIVNDDWTIDNYKEAASKRRETLELFIDRFGDLWD